MIRQVIPKADDVFAFDQADIRDFGEIREPPDRRAHVRDEVSVDFFLEPHSISNPLVNAFIERLAGSTSHSGDGCDHLPGHIDRCCLLAPRSIDRIGMGVAHGFAALTVEDDIERAEFGLQASTQDLLVVRRRNR
ncbi:hypothetical protein BV511_15030 [Methylorubrum extorquens]|nr:hypothetical protein BV511_15030 [Methylorubrum extorquens]